jgi:hypothetical protein
MFEWADVFVVIKQAKVRKRGEAEGGGGGN